MGDFRADRDDLVSLLLGPEQANLAWRDCWRFGWGLGRLDNWSTDLAGAWFWSARVYSRRSFFPEL